jgi:small subunit ribosomal protein S10
MIIKAKEKIRIKLESFDSKLINISCKEIIEKIQLTGAKIVGPIPLPIKKRIYCVLRSPHVNKDSREHFEIKKYSRLIDIYPVKKDTTNSLLSISLPSGVKTIIK